MQPAQLSLLPPQCPAPPQIVLAHLPESETVEAIELLASLIAKAATAPDREVGNE
ncbi:MAG TPA: hypothetical protein VHX38_35890 [Pseudonocardiaceae bacterium]|nr:hypothetical protein [Pseudonocardiaceae bacterium]